MSVEVVQLDDFYKKIAVKRGGPYNFLNISNYINYYFNEGELKVERFS
ncbi:hypothetical protein [Candidatus Oleimmundimicrobium sp.]|nr:hypothetical protein [Candidatus Oleimmundimicrobium sp.]MDO8886841.1 hypothetical protein [Candidatus Oleimmundimicrobium sp.]